MVYAGPIILGFSLGFILGSRIRDNPESEMNFSTSVYIVFIIVLNIIKIKSSEFCYMEYTTFLEHFFLLYSVCIKRNILNKLYKYYIYYIYNIYFIYYISNKYYIYYIY